MTPAFRWSLIVLIPLTLTWKLVVADYSIHETQGRIVPFLKTHGFEATEQTLAKTVPVVRASRGNCSMVLAEVSPDGSTRDVMRHVATTMDKQFVVFQARVYNEQPVWLTVTE